ncbi:ubiquitin carboxyl-terminal hydrolase [Acrasis kona]|uniref:Ubiquitin carboxyl-terminal hydrolase n=1 Tax=Acrasis kona TaxID=1008807 RepID=A0AAW2YZ86_9EUKA
MKDDSYLVYMNAPPYVQVRNQFFLADLIPLPYVFKTPIAESEIDDSILYDIIDYEDILDYSPEQWDEKLRLEEESRQILEEGVESIKLQLESETEESEDSMIERDINATHSVEWSYDEEAELRELQELEERRIRRQELLNSLKQEVIPSAPSPPTISTPPPNVTLRSSNKNIQRQAWSAPAKVLEPITSEKITTAKRSLKSSKLRDDDADMWKNVFK